MSEPTQDQEPVVIQVETERVEGVIDLDDLVGVVRALQEEAARPQGPLTQFRPGGPLRPRPDLVGRPDLPDRPDRPGLGLGRPGQSGPPGQGTPDDDVEQRLQAVNRLAGELAEQLAALARLQQR